jgi:hypothetical protein
MRDIIIIIIIIIILISAAATHSPYLFPSSDSTTVHVNFNYLFIFLFILLEFISLCRWSVAIVSPLLRFCRCSLVVRSLLKHLLLLLFLLFSFFVRHCGNSLLLFFVTLLPFKLKMLITIYFELFINIFSLIKLGKLMSEKSCVTFSNLRFKKKSFYKLCLCIFNIFYLLLD